MRTPPALARIGNNSEKDPIPRAFGAPRHTRADSLSWRAARGRPAMNRAGNLPPLPPAPTAGDPGRRGWAANKTGSSQRRRARAANTAVSDPAQAGRAGAAVGR